MIRLHRRKCKYKQPASAIIKSLVLNVYLIALLTTAPWDKIYIIPVTSYWYWLRCARHQISCAQLFKANITLVILTSACRFMHFKWWLWTVRTTWTWRNTFNIFCKQQLVYANEDRQGKGISRICVLFSRALSSFMLVQNDRWHPDMRDIFGRDNLQNIHKTLQEQFSVGASRFAFNKQLLDAMVDIVKVKAFWKEVVHITDYYIWSQAKKDSTCGFPNRPPCTSSQVIKH